MNMNPRSELAMRVVATSQIDGEFEGMDFDRVFALVNGQRWEQVTQAYRYHYMYMPKVTVLGENGRCYLRVSGFDTLIEVRRFD